MGGASMNEYMNEEFNADGTLVHPEEHQEGSRRHVIWWSTSGRHCSEPNCELNKS